MHLLLLSSLLTSYLVSGGAQYIPNTGGGQGSQVTGTWVTWSAWSTCSVSCGQGVRRRTRQCRQGTCLGPSSQNQRCDQGQCPSGSRSAFTQWSAWSPCSSTCDTGRTYRFRQCVGQRCYGPRLELNVCDDGPCTTTTASAAPGNVTSSVTTTVTVTTTRTPTTKRNCLPSVNRSDTGSCRDNPWTVRFDLYRNFNNNSFDGNIQIPFCHGVLLSATTILTTRSCSLAMEAVDTNGIHVVAFAGLFPNSTQMRNISRVISANSTGSSDIDLALLTVSPPFTLDACAAPACLSVPDDVFLRETNCRITGWEPSNDSGNEFIVTSIQTEAHVSFVPTNICQDIYRYAPANIRNVTVYDDTVCSLPSSTGTSICEVDNGWMLTCEDGGDRPTLVGISSGSTCSPIHPSTFQGIQTHMDWINSVLYELQ